MFLDFVNFYRWFIKNFSNIAALLTLILKMITLLASARPGCIGANKNEADTNGSDNVGGSRFNNTIANLSSNIKKISSKAGFLTFKASLAFTQLKKIFIEALILHHFDLKYYI